MKKEVVWMGSTLKDIKNFPEAARSEAGQALYLAQLGERSISTSPLTGFGGASVLEIIIPEKGDTFRAIYTTKFDTAIYVLHAFKKKAKKGIKTPLQDMKLVRSRLKDAEILHRAKAKAAASEKKNE
ncbi:MAG TPA: type II toxin-antitoxin system RelE/ParE family toxin [Rhizomicrobium sp.]|jgi:phage-related protein|nr:type II toxin-antitoxin system RelE/ParE family toxin [Rhizomicrobium sp.]